MTLLASVASEPVWSEVLVLLLTLALAAIVRWIEKPTSERESAEEVAREIVELLSPTERERIQRFIQQRMNKVLDSEDTPSKKKRRMRRLRTIISVIKSLKSI
jgi:hypothetical protein